LKKRREKEKNEVGNKRDKTRPRCRKTKTCDDCALTDGGKKGTPELGMPEERGKSAANYCGEGFHECWARKDIVPGDRHKGQLAESTKKRKKRGSDGTGGVLSKKPLEPQARDAAGCPMVGGSPRAKGGGGWGHTGRGEGEDETK